MKIYDRHCSNPKDSHYEDGCIQKLVFDTPNQRLRPNDDRWNLNAPFVTLQDYTQDENGVYTHCTPGMKIENIYLEGPMGICE